MYCPNTGSYVILMKSIKIGGQERQIDSLAFGTPLVSMNSLTKGPVDEKAVFNLNVGFDATYLGLPLSMFDETHVTVYPFDGSNKGKQNFTALFDEVRRRSYNIYGNAFGGAIVGVVHLKLQTNKMMTPCDGNAQSSLIAASQLVENERDHIPVLKVLQGTSNNKITVFMLKTSNVEQQIYDDFNAACRQHVVFQEFRTELANIFGESHRACSIGMKSPSRSDGDAQIQLHVIQQYVDTIKKKDEYTQKIKQSIKLIQSFMNNHEIREGELIQFSNIPLFKNAQDALEEYKSISDKERRRQSKNNNLYAIKKCLACILYMIIHARICDKELLSSLNNTINSITGIVTGDSRPRAPLNIVDSSMQLLLAYLKDDITSYDVLWKQVSTDFNHWNCDDASIDDVILKINEYVNENQGNDSFKEKISTSLLAIRNFLDVSEVREYILIDIPINLVNKAKQVLEGYKNIKSNIDSLEKQINDGVNGLEEKLQTEREVLDSFMVENKTVIKMCFVCIVYIISFAQICQNNEDIITTIHDIFNKYGATEVTESENNTEKTLKENCAELLSTYLRNENYDEIWKRVYKSYQQWFDDCRTEY